MSKLHIECGCGNSIGVTPSMCGTTATCIKCNESVVVPAYSSFRSTADLTDRNRKRSRYLKAIEKHKFHRNALLALLVVVTISTALQYAKIFTVGQLPNWYGLVAISACSAGLIYSTQQLRKNKNLVSRLN